MKEHHTLRERIDVGGAAVTITNPVEGDVVDVTDVDEIEATVTAKSDGYDEVHIKTVPARNEDSDVAIFYVEGNAEMFGKLRDVFEKAHDEAVELD